MQRKYHHYRRSAKFFGNAASEKIFSDKICLNTSVKAYVQDSEMDLGLLQHARWRSL